MLHTLSRSLRENKGPALVTVLLSALEVVFEIVIPLFMSNLIDFGIEGGSMAAVWKFGAFLLLLAAFQLATGVLAARIAARASVGFGANLREDMYNNVQTFAFSNIDKFSTASIVTRLTTDVTNVQNAFQMLMRMAIRSPVMLVFSMIVSFRISRDISMTFLIILPILAVALFFIIRSVFPIFTRVFRTYDELNNVVQENVRGIRVVKSFNQEQHEIRKFGAISERIYKDFSKGERLITLNAPLMQSLHLRVHDHHLLARRQGHHRQRQRSGAWPDDRQPHRAHHLRHADPLEPDDVVHGLCHADDLALVRAPHRRGDRGKDGHSKSGAPDHGRARRRH